MRKNLAGARLRRLITEALKERQGHRGNLPAGVAPPVWPAWPYVDDANILGSAVSKEIGTEEKSQKELEWRLDQILYPYPEGNKSGKTFYKHVQQLGVLDLLTKPPLLYEIRRVWWFQRHYDEELRLRSEKRSEHGHLLGFHRRAMFECAAHWYRLRALADRYAVPEKWLEGHRRAVLEEILREAAICYPQLLKGYRPALQIRPRLFKVDIQIGLYDAIEAAFSTKKIGGRKYRNHKLAWQLTALLCSNREEVATRHLNPKPEKVRNNLRDRTRSRRPPEAKRVGFS